MPNHHNRLSTLGLVLHRMGQYEEALTRMGQARLQRGSAPDVWTFLPPALALEKFGKTEEARTSYHRALRWLDENDAKFQRWHWVERQEIGALRREAAALLEKQ